MDQILATAWKMAKLDAEPLALFALGKLGASELNLSSDVDIVVVKEDGYEVPLSLLQNFQKIVCENSAFGFCTRIDMDLRPGGRLGPLVSSVSQFIDYYGNHGETWERLAFTRFRPVVGSKKIIDEISLFIQKYTYRRHLDYTLLDDLKVLRGQIHQHYLQTSESVFNLKLGIGGIRDIELFVHALLIIHGGRRPSLRTNITHQAIQNLSAEQLLPSDEAKFLIEAYWRLRYLENRLQIIEDQQTHSLDQRLHPHFFNECNSQEFTDLTSKVSHIVGTLMGPPRSKLSPLPSTELQQEEWLYSLGFNEHSVREVWPKLRSATVLSRRTEQDERERQLFLANFVIALNRTSIDKDLGLSILTDFVKATRAKATFFTLLNNNPAIIENLSWLFSASPYLGTLLTSRPELVDGFILHSQLSPDPDTDVLLQQLADRRLLNEIHTASNFLANRNILMLLESLSEVADSVCRDLLGHASSHLPSGSINLLCLGKWGGRELGLRSDLDFLFLNTSSEQEATAKVAKRFTTLITAKNQGGSLYSIDLRLRPTGSAGPLLVSFDRVESYLMGEAAAWERQAYLRARLLTGSLPDTFFNFVEKGLSTDEISQLKSIRLQLHAKAKSSLDVKYSPGGLIDIEFSAQTALLKNQLKPSGSSTLTHIQTLAEHLPEWKSAQADLIQYYLWIRSLEQNFQLLSASPGSDPSRDPETVRRLSRLYSTSEDSIQLEIRRNLGLCRDILKSLDPILS
jgi:glutamate-ammonia-ligase adenylyltransferase